MAKRVSRLEVSRRIVEELGVGYRGVTPNTNAGDLMLDVITPFQFPNGDDLFVRVTGRYQTSGYRYVVSDNGQLNDWLADNNMYWTYRHNIYNKRIKGIRDELGLHQFQHDGVRMLYGRVKGDDFTTSIPNLSRGILKIADEVHKIKFSKAPMISITNKEDRFMACAGYISSDGTRWVK